MLHPSRRISVRHVALIVGIALSMPIGAEAQAAKPSVCSREGALSAEIGAIATDGTITLKEGLLLRLANIIWPDHLEPGVREKLAIGLTETLRSQRVSWKPAAGPDRWGIVPAYLFVQEPAIAEQPDLPPFWLQAGMLEAGLVPAWPEFSYGVCWETLLSHEKIAIERRRGHWAPRVQAQRLARIVTNPSAHAGRRIVVQWRVASARKWRDLVFLNMGAQQREGAALSMAPATISALTQRGLPPESLAGQRIIARIAVPAEGLRRARLESAEHLTPIGNTTAMTQSRSLDKGETPPALPRR
ncbi:MAG: hypothetical protein ACRDBL_06950 [Rhabdaerophilum sp.]